jgi:ABC-2 type transport system ATP-binding protein
VVRDLTLEISQGTIFGFLGPNGAGKSTTVRMMAGLTQPDNGDALILGRSITTEALAVKRTIGAVPDELALFEYLTIGEHLGLIQATFVIDEETFRRRAAQLLELFGLSADSEKLVRDCSYGMRKKTSLAMALLPNPQVLILDEPFEGLDPVMILTLKQAMKSAAQRGTTIFLTTHLLRSACDLLDRYAMIRDGRLVAQGRSDELSRAGVTLEEAYFKQFCAPQSEGMEWLG